jgi:hypothetical protein
MDSIEDIYFNQTFNKLSKKTQEELNSRGINSIKGLLSLTMEELHNYGLSAEHISYLVKTQNKKKKITHKQKSIIQSKKTSNIDNSNLLETYLIKDKVTINSLENESNYKLLISVDISDDILIKNLNLSARTYNCLFKNGIHDVSDLRLLTIHKLMKFKNFGSSCLKELYKLEDNGYASDLIALIKDGVNNKESYLNRSKSINVSKYIKVYELYMKLGTLELVGKSVGLTKQRVRMILAKGAEYGLFTLPSKRNNINEVKKSFSTREDLYNELIKYKTVTKMQTALSVNPLIFNKILNEFNLNIIELKKENKMREAKIKYDEMVSLLGFHPSTTFMSKTPKFRAIWRRIIKIFGSMDNFRKKYSYTLIQNGN